MEMLPYLEVAIDDDNEYHVIQYHEFWPILVSQGFKVIWTSMPD